MARLTTRRQANRAGAHRRGSATPQGACEVTLEARINGLFAQMVDYGQADCPVCAGHMHPAAGCRDCGSSLS